MNRHSRTAAARAEHDHYRPSFTAALLALALAVFLLWHGMARAESLTPQDGASQSTPVGLPPTELGCTDDMDFSPDDNLPSPFDADKVAFRQMRALGMQMRPIAVDDGCQGTGPGIAHEPVSL